jgi:hypothetical protein
MDRGIGGPLIAPSAYFMKSPPVQYTDSEALDLVEDFIAGKEISVAEIQMNGNGHRANGHSRNGHSMSVGADALRRNP